MTLTHEHFCEHAMDVLDSLKDEDRRKVEYITEQLMDPDKRPQDEFFVSDLNAVFETGKDVLRAAGYPFKEA